MKRSPYWEGDAFSLHEAERKRRIPTRNLLMRSFRILAVLMTLFTGTGVVGQAEKSIKIGIYDSRAVAIAFANSDYGQTRYRDLRNEMDAAKAANDDKRIAGIKEKAQARQQVQHLQGFSTGSVGPLLEMVKEALPAVAQKAGVRMIVSKWEVTYKDSSIEYVDVTMDLVALFHPNSQAIKWIGDLPKHEPLPMEMMMGHVD